MGSSINDTKKARVKAKLELGTPPNVVAEEEHLKLRTVQRFATNIRRYGSMQAPRALHQGRPRTITPEMEQV
jgi:transposase